MKNGPHLFLLSDNQVQERGPVTHGDYNCQRLQHEWQDNPLKEFFC